MNLRVIKDTENYSTWIQLKVCYKYLIDLQMKEIINLKTIYLQHVYNIYIVSNIWLFSIFKFNVKIYSVFYSPCIFYLI